MKKTNKTQEIKQNHTEPNPLYEFILDEIAGQVGKAINTLEVSGLHTSNWHVFRAHKILSRLHSTFDGDDE